MWAAGSTGSSDAFSWRSSGAAHSLWTLGTRRPNQALRSPCACCASGTRGPRRALHAVGIVVETDAWRAAGTWQPRISIGTSRSCRTGGSLGSWRPHLPWRARRTQGTRWAGEDGAVVAWHRKSRLIHAPIAHHPGEDDDNDNDSHNNEANAKEERGVGCFISAASASCFGAHGHISFAFGNTEVGRWKAVLNEASFLYSS